MDVISEDSLHLFLGSGRLLVAGYSNSGKSFLTAQIIKKYSAYFDKIIVSGVEKFPIEDKYNNISILKNELYDPFDENFIGDGNIKILAVYDDLILNKEAEEIICRIFVKGRHKNISIIYITQHLYLQSKSHRIISLNASHIVLMRIRDINQIRYFARTFLEKNKIDSFVKVYEKYVIKKDYGYILIDFSINQNPKLMIRSDIVGEAYEKAIIL
jgi:hypothetical protein